MSVYVTFWLYIPDNDSAAGVHRDEMRTKWQQEVNISNVTLIYVYHLVANHNTCN